MEQIQVNSSETRPFTQYDADYKALVRHMQATLQARLDGGRTSLFRTKTEMKPTPQMVEHGISVDVTLNHVYLGAITEDERQYHTCSCCASFMKHYAGVVTIDAEGKTHAALWDSETFPQDNYYFTLVERMQEVIESGRVIGVFKDSNVVWGDFSKGGFEHFGIMAPTILQYREAKLTPRQKQAELKQDYERMSKVFANVNNPDDKFGLPNLTKLMRILEADVLPGDETISGPATWLMDVASVRSKTGNQRVKDNLLWREIASVPAGFTHPNTTMVGTVLDDLLEGLTFDDIKKKYAKKTAADVYRRPVAAPKISAIEAAEKLVEKLGIQMSLRRRVGYLSDIPDSACSWHEKNAVRPEEAKPTSIFGHLKPKDAVDVAKEEMILPAVTMSWNKFVDEVLPKVQDVEMYIPAQNDFFGALATAADAEAPPILMYDFDDARNPVSAYQRSDKDYLGRLIGISPTTWNMEPNKYHQVSAIFKAPHMWGTASFPQLGEQIFFALEGAYDKTIESPDHIGIALFPALLRSDLHEISRVVEAFSNKARFEGDPTKQVCGPSISRGGKFAPRRLRVQTGYGPRVIIIDRWE